MQHDRALARRPPTVEDPITANLPTAAARRDGPAAMRTFVRLTSGLVVLFAAFGFGSWFSGAASWAAFYLGARGPALEGVAQASAVLGVALGVAGAVGWYWRRCRAGRTDVPPAAVLSACLALPLGNIFWAIFVDAIAWHYGQDIVRPAFDHAIMYVVLGGVLPLTLGVPLITARLARR